MTSFTYYFRCFVLECLDSSEIFEFESFLKPQVDEVTDGRDCLFVMCLLDVLHNGGLVLDWILLSIVLMMIKAVRLITECSVVLRWCFFFLLRKEERGSIPSYWRKYWVFPPIKATGSRILQQSYKYWPGSVEKIYFYLKNGPLFHPGAQSLDTVVWVAEVTEQFAAWEWGKPTPSLSCEQDSALTLDLVPTCALRELVHLPPPAKTSASFFFLGCLSELN